MQYIRSMMSYGVLLKQSWGTEYMVSRTKHNVFSLLFALIVVGPISWFALDREPPQTRLYGTIASAIDPTRFPRAGEEFVVTWETTPHIRDCSGLVQTEIIDNEHVIWPRLERKAFRSQLNTTILIPPTWLLPSLVAPGPATYRVTTFWYCNWFQRWFDNPIVQIGPDVPFTVLPP